MITAASVHVEETPIPLKEAPGREAVEKDCGSCHSLDYLPTNSPFLDRAGWQAERTKMTNVFGAPIPPEDTNAIVDYLTKNYGIGG
jgi:sulfite dehydrogenase (cytochrome) subunit B